MKPRNPKDAGDSNLIPFIFLVVFASFLFIPPPPIFAGQFTVSPIRLQFDPKTRSGVIHVLNEEEEPLQVQINAYVWTQDEAGKDQYVKTEDLLFFPKLATINPNQERIIRVGTKSPPKDQEKTYRLFVEEIPRKDPAQGPAAVRVAIRFGVPIFVTPEKQHVQGRVENMALKAGKLQLVVQNQGNTHFIIESIMIRGADKKGEANFSKELSGWYLLTGSKRAYETEIPQDLCLTTSAFDIEVKTSDFVLSEKLNVDQSLCLH